MEVPVALQLPLFLKVLSFDRNLSARAGDTLVVGVAYQSGYRASGVVKDAIVRAGAGLRPAAGDLPFRIVAIDLDRESLATALSRLGVAILYVAPVRGVDMKAVAATTRAARVTTLTGVSHYVEQGLSVGLRLRGDRPQILVNLDASRLEGAEFGAEFLKLVQVQ
jgi:hypothetical protein